ncbi:hypothetical protein PInf_012790 [Phytophthora infestans]|nr:hypothetical protein PInf_012790 [Phytophthora infestans]
MSAADFDDIFGDDPKMDATGAPTLTNVHLDDDDLLGGEPSGKVTKPSQPSHGSNWEQIGSHEQDEFLSWLDDGGSSQPATTAITLIPDAPPLSSNFVPPPAPVPVAPTSATTFDSVSLDDNDDFDRMLEGTSTITHAPPPISRFDTPSSVSLDDDDDLDRMLDAQPSSFESGPISVEMANNTAPDSGDDLDRMLQSTTSQVYVTSDTSNSVSFDDDDDLEQLVKSAGASTFVSAGNISLDDDDDDDLERIVQKANKQANASSSRENSSSSLQIKSQVHAPHKIQIDVLTARQIFLETGELPASARLALWQRAVQPGTEIRLRSHARILREVGDNMRGTHLLFIDSAETLVTYLCSQLNIDYYSGMVLTFAPLLLASGSEPLHPETVETLAATCRRFLPHVSQKVPLHSSTIGRRPLLKRMLLYHAPRLASHLNQHFPTWNQAPPEECDGTKDSGAIPDSWLGSFFEGEGVANAPLTTGCFITLYAIVTAEKALMRMQGEQLRHCMATTLLDTLLRGEATKDNVFVRGIRHLMDSTPPCICAKLRSAGTPPPAVIEDDVKPTEAQTSGTASNNFGMNNLLSASTQGLKDVSNMMIDMPVKLMIDMPVKLLTMVPLNPMAALSSPTSTSLTDSPEAQQLFYLHVKAMDVASVSVTLEVSEVIPSVFGGIQGHETGSLRYFIVDCRGKEDMRRGQVPTAFHFDPNAVSDPAVLDQVLATIGPLKSAGVHICVMGQGYAHIAEELRQFQQKQGVASASPFCLSEEFLETYANDQTRVQSTIEFLLKHEFPRVSVLDGGYSAAHGHLFRSQSLTVDDLADHDTPNCQLCQHDRAFKTGSKTLLSPTVDGTKWLLKKSAATTAEFANAAASMGNMGNKTRTGSMKDTAATAKAREMKPAMPNLSKWRTSLVAIGSESLDMLKKVESAMEHAVEQAAVATTTTTAKVRVPFPATFSPTPKEAGAVTSPSTGKSPAGSTSSSGTPPAPRAVLSADPAHSKFFHESTDEMFTIDDDDDDEDQEGHFVQGVDAGGSRTSATSSFAKDSPVGASVAGPIHEVIKGHKGMTVSRTQMLSCVSSPFFACYKKKTPIGNAGAASRSSMNPRRVVVMENNLVVLRSATRNEDDSFIVKSCHPLSHITRMTCLKKNALMVSIYYKWKADDGQIVEKRNSYEVQQRDDFIKAVKTTMEKM